MRKRQRSPHDKWNISVVICDTYNFYRLKPGHVVDRKSCEVMIST